MSSVEPSIPAEPPRDRPLPQRRAHPIPPNWVAFGEVPGLLLIRLMSRCNEKCRFCMVADEIEQSDDVDFQEAESRILAQPEGTHIEFFGGEPTIYPRFLELLRLARRRGHPCSIASNCRAFHSDKFTAAVAELDPSQIYIRTTLLGDTADLHDFNTATPGSYRQTVKGIENIVRAGFTCQVNIVILAGNYTQLPAMVDLVADWGVPRIKFGNLMGVRFCEPLAVSLATVRPYLREAIAVAERRDLKVTVEKTPICVAAGRIDLMSTERELGQWPRAYDDMGECGACLVRPWCDGLDPDYVAIFGYDGIERVASVSATVLRGTSRDSGEPELLRTHCVEIADGPIDGDTTTGLVTLLHRVEAKHGRLAVFPSRYILR